MGLLWNAWTPPIPSCGAKSGPETVKMTPRGVTFSPSAPGQKSANTPSATWVDPPPGPHPLRGLVRGWYVIKDTNDSNCLYPWRRIPPKGGVPPQKDRQTPQKGGSTLQNDHFIVNPYKIDPKTIKIDEKSTFWGPKTWKIDSKLMFLTPQKHLLSLSQGGTWNSLSRSNKTQYKMAFFQKTPPFLPPPDPPKGGGYP